MKLKGMSRNKLKKLKVNLKLITDGDISGALLVTDDKYKVDIFLGIGGGPEGVLAASALDAFNCNFQGRFIFETEEDKTRGDLYKSEFKRKKLKLALAESCTGGMLSSKITAVSGSSKVFELGLVTYLSLIHI